MKTILEQSLTPACAIDKPFLLEELLNKVAKYWKYLSPCLVQTVA